jgi:hypothetical protein
VVALDIAGKTLRPGSVLRLHLDLCAAPASA